MIFGMGARSAQLKPRYPPVPRQVTIFMLTKSTNRLDQHLCQAAHALATVAVAVAVAIIFAAWELTSMVLCSDDLQILEASTMCRLVTGVALQQYNLAFHATLLAAQVTWPGWHHYLSE